MFSKLLKPQALSSGATVAVIPLASQVKKDIYIAGEHGFAKYSLKPKKILDPVFSGYKSLFCAAPAKKRAKALEGAFREREVDGVLALRGGYGSQEMLPFLNFEVFRKHPKLFVGYSDLTALLINLYQRAGLICVHGPSYIVSGFKIKQGEQPAERNLKALDDLLKGRIINPFKGVKLLPLKKSRNEVSGRLIGGNLTMLVSLLGTDWEPNFDNHIVFIEETGEPPYKVHRMLLQLKQASKLKRVKALLLGDFIDSRKNIDPGEPSYDDVVLDLLKQERFPIYKGFPVGHGEVNLPVPIGVQATLKANQLEIKEQAVIL